MIPTFTTTTYAQYHEDLILAALLSDVKKGFYVDVGANHEEYHSVTKYFYERGWKGINIEPIPRLYEEISKKRKRDINLNIAASSRKATLDFREYPEHDGLSTLSKSSKHEDDKKELPYVDYKVKVDTLAGIFKANDVTRIDFLKIDVEGFEEEVLRGNDWRKYVPTVVCIEANHRSTDWSKLLKDSGYRIFINDGLNEYYVLDAQWDITSHFAEKVTLLAHNALPNHYRKLWKNDVNNLSAMHKMANNQAAAILALTSERDELKREVRSTQFLLRQLVKRIIRRH